MNAIFSQLGTFGDEDDNNMQNFNSVIQSHTLHVRGFDEGGAPMVTELIENAMSGLGLGFVSRGVGARSLQMRDSLVTMPTLVRHPCISHYLRILTDCSTLVKHIPSIFQEMLDDPTLFVVMADSPFSLFGKGVRDAASKWWIAYARRFLNSGNLVADTTDTTATTAAAEEDVTEGEARRRQQLRSVLTLTVALCAPYRIVRPQFIPEVNSTARLMLCGDPSVIYLGLILNCRHPFLPTKVQQGMPVMHVIAHGWGSSVTLTEIMGRCWQQYKAAKAVFVSGGAGAGGPEGRGAAPAAIRLAVPAEPSAIVPGSVFEAGSVPSDGDRGLDLEQAARRCLVSMREAADDMWSLLWWARCRIICFGLLVSTNAEEVLAGPAYTFFSTIWDCVDLATEILREEEAGEEMSGSGAPGVSAVREMYACLIGTIADVSHLWRVVSTKEHAAAMSLPNTNTLWNAVHTRAPANPRFTRERFRTHGEYWQHLLLVDGHITQVIPSHDRPSRTDTGRIALLVDMLQRYPEYHPAFVVRTLGAASKTEILNAAVDAGLMRALLLCLRYYVPRVVATTHTVTAETDAATPAAESVLSEPAEEAPVMPPAATVTVEFAEELQLTVTSYTTILTVLEALHHCVSRVVHPSVNPVSFLLTPPPDISDVDGDGGGSDLCAVLHALLRQRRYPSLISATMALLAASTHHSMRDMIPALLERGVVQAVLEIAAASPLFMMANNADVGGDDSGGVTSEAALQPLSRVMSSGSAAEEVWPGVPEISFTTMVPCEDSVARAAMCNLVLPTLVQALTVHEAARGVFTSNTAWSKAALGVFLVQPEAHFDDDIFFWKNPFAHTDPASVGGSGAATFTAKRAAAPSSLMCMDELGEEADLSPRHLQHRVQSHGRNDGAINEWRDGMLGGAVKDMGLLLRSAPEFVDVLSSDLGRLACHIAHSVSEIARDPGRFTVASAEAITVSLLNAMRATIELSTFVTNRQRRDALRDVDYEGQRVSTALMNIICPALCKALDLQWKLMASIPPPAAQARPAGAEETAEGVGSVHGTMHTSALALAMAGKFTGRTLAELLYVIPSVCLGAVVEKIESYAGEVLSQVVASAGAAGVSMTPPLSEMMCPHNALMLTYLLSTVLQTPPRTSASSANTPLTKARTSTFDCLIRIFVELRSQRPAAALGSSQPGLSGGGAVHGTWSGGAEVMSASSPVSPSDNAVIFRSFEIYTPGEGGSGATNITTTVGPNGQALQAHWGARGTGAVSTLESAQVGNSAQGSAEGDVDEAVLLTPSDLVAGFYGKMEDVLFNGGQGRPSSSSMVPSAVSRLRTGSFGQVDRSAALPVDPNHLMQSAAMYLSELVEECGAATNYMSGDRTRGVSASDATGVTSTAQFVLKVNMQKLRRASALLLALQTCGALRRSRFSSVSITNEFTSNMHVVVFNIENLGRHCFPLKSGGRAAAEASEREGDVAEAALVAERRAEVGELLLTVSQSLLQLPVRGTYITSSWVERTAPLLYFVFNVLPSLDGLAVPPQLYVEAFAQLAEADPGLFTLISKDRAARHQIPTVHPPTDFLDQAAAELPFNYGRGYDSDGDVVRGGGGSVWPADRQRILRHYVQDSLDYMKAHLITWVCDACSGCTFSLQELSAPNLRSLRQSGCRLLWACFAVQREEMTTALLARMLKLILTQTKEYFRLMEYVAVILTQRSTVTINETLARTALPLALLERTHKAIRELATEQSPQAKAMKDEMLTQLYNLLSTFRNLRNVTMHRSTDRRVRVCRHFDSSSSPGFCWFGHHCSLFHPIPWRPPGPRGLSDAEQRLFELDKDHCRVVELVLDALGEAGYPTPLQVSPSPTTTGPAWEGTAGSTAGDEHLSSDLLSVEEDREEEDESGVASASNEGDLNDEGDADLFAPAVTREAGRSSFRVNRVQPEGFYLGIEDVRNPVEAMRGMMSNHHNFPDWSRFRPSVRAAYAHLISPPLSVPRCKYILPDLSHPEEECADIDLLARLAPNVSLLQAPVAETLLDVILSHLPQAEATVTVGPTLGKTTRESVRPHQQQPPPHQQRVAGTLSAALASRTERIREVAGSLNLPHHGSLYLPDSATRDPNQKTLPSLTVLLLTQLLQRDYKAVVGRLHQRMREDRGLFPRFSDCVLQEDVFLQAGEMGIELLRYVLDDVHRAEAVVHRRMCETLRYCVDHRMAVYVEDDHYREFLQKRHSAPQTTTTSTAAAMEVGSQGPPPPSAPELTRGPADYHRYMVPLSALLTGRNSALTSYPLVFLSVLRQCCEVRWTHGAVPGASTEMWLGVWVQPTPPLIQADSERAQDGVQPPRKQNSTSSGTTTITTAAAAVLSSSSHRRSQREALEYLLNDVVRCMNSGRLTRRSATRVLDSLAERPAILQTMCSSTIALPVPAEFAPVAVCGGPAPVPSLTSTVVQRDVAAHPAAATTATSGAAPQSMAQMLRSHGGGAAGGTHPFASGKAASGKAAAAVPLPINVPAYLAIALHFNGDAHDFPSSFFSAVAQRTPTRFAADMIDVLTRALHALGSRGTGAATAAEEVGEDDGEGTQLRRFICVVLHIMRKCVVLSESSASASRLCDELSRRQGLSLLYDVVRHRCCESDRDGTTLLLLLRRLLLTAQGGDSNPTQSAECDPAHNPSRHHQRAGHPSHHHEDPHNLQGQRPQEEAMLLLTATVGSDYTSGIPESPLLLMRPADILSDPRLPQEDRLITPRDENVAPGMVISMNHHGGRYINGDDDDDDEDEDEDDEGDNNPDGDLYEVEYDYDNSSEQSSEQRSNSSEHLAEGVSRDGGANAEDPDEDSSHSTILDQLPEDDDEEGEDGYDDDDDDDDDDFTDNLDEEDSEDISFDVGMNRGHSGNNDDHSSMMWSEASSADYLFAGLDMASALSNFFNTDTRLGSQQQPFTMAGRLLAGPPSAADIDVLTNVLESIARRFVPVTQDNVTHTTAMAPTLTATEVQLPVSRPRTPPQLPVETEAPTVEDAAVSRQVSVVERLLSLFAAGDASAETATPPLAEAAASTTVPSVTPASAEEEERETSPAAPPPVPPSDPADQPWIGSIDPLFLVELPPDVRSEVVFNSMGVIRGDTEYERLGQRTRLLPGFLDQLPDDTQRDVLSIERRWTRVSGADRNQSSHELYEILRSVDADVRRDVLLSCDLNDLRDHPELLSLAQQFRAAAHTEERAVPSPANAEGGRQPLNLDLFSLGDTNAHSGATATAMRQVRALSNAALGANAMVYSGDAPAMAAAGALSATEAARRGNTSLTAAGGPSAFEGRSAAQARGGRGGTETIAALMHPQVLRNALMEMNTALNIYDSNSSGGGGVQGAVMATPSLPMNLAAFGRQVPNVEMEGDPDAVPPSSARAAGSQAGAALAEQVPADVLLRCVELLRLQKSTIPRGTIFRQDAPLLETQLVAFLRALCVDMDAAAGVVKTLLSARPATEEGLVSAAVRRPVNTAEASRSRALFILLTLSVLCQLTSTTRNAAMAFLLLPDTDDAGAAEPSKDAPLTARESHFQRHSLLALLTDVALTHIHERRVRDVYLHILRCLNKMLRSIEATDVPIEGDDPLSETPLSDRVIAFPRHVHRLAWTNVRQFPAYASGFICNVCGINPNSNFAFHCHSCNFDLCPGCAARRGTQAADRAWVARSSYHIIASPATLRSALALLSNRRCDTDVAVSLVALLERGIKESARRDGGALTGGSAESAIKLVEGALIDLSRRCVSEISACRRTFKELLRQQVAAAGGDTGPASLGTSSSAFASTTLPENFQFTTDTAIVILYRMNIPSSVDDCTRLLFLSFAETLRPEPREVALLWHAVPLYIEDITRVLQHLPDGALVPLPPSVLGLMLGFCQYHLSESRLAAMSASASTLASRTNLKGETERFMVESTRDPSLLSNRAVEQSTSEEATAVRSTTPGSPSEHRRLPRVVRRFLEANRATLNMLLYWDATLLNSHFAFLKAEPSLIDFTFKLNDFRSSIDTQRGPRISLTIDRARCLQDSFKELQRVKAFNGPLQVRFRGEEGADAGGLTREWFRILSEDIVNESYALFLHSKEGFTYQPNPLSDINANHLEYFHFAGTAIGLAVANNVPIDIHFTRAVYRHMVGIAPVFDDLESVDPEMHSSLKWALSNDVTDLGLTFAVNYERFGDVQEDELIPNGKDIVVTNVTKLTYVRLLCEFYMTKRIEPQLTEFLKGFYSVIPRSSILCFTEQELELVICGMPNIDIEDLRANTAYEGFTSASPQIRWFWEVVASMTKEDKANLLQFSTGASKVPHGGFSQLVSSGGQRQRFTISRWDDSSELLPRAHTCFNKIDLPEYPNAETLREKLMIAITFGSMGFTMM